MILLYWLIYNFVTDNKNIKIVDKARYVLYKVDEADKKYKIAFIKLNNLFLKDV